jgi:hypothetical protein
MGWISAKAGPGEAVVNGSVRVTHPVKRNPTKGNRNIISNLNLVESGSVMVVIMVVAAMIAMIRMPPIATAARKNTT